MKENIKKFDELNEGNENDKLDIENLTFGEFLNMVENDEIGTLVNYDKRDLIDSINDSIKRNPDFLDQNVLRGKYEIQSFKRLGFIISYSIGEFVMIFNEDKTGIDAIISEYEMMNPFLFGDVVIVPGHDSITLYNKVTKEHTVAHIR